MSGEQKTLIEPGGLQVFPAAQDKPATPEQILLSAISEVGAEIEAKLDDKMIQDEGTAPWPHSDWNYASEIHHPCMKNLVHCRRDWKQKRPKDAETLWRIKEGIRYESWLRGKLGAIGFELVRNQERFQWPEYKISGKTDGLTPLNRILPEPFKIVRDIPAEIKFMNQVAFDKVQSIEDFRTARGWWLRKYPSQLNCYMMMDSKPAGFLIIGTAQRRPKVLPMLLDYELGEVDLQMAQAVNRHIADGTTPEPIPFDRQVCEMCDFNHICQPLKPSGSTIEIDPSEAIHLETFLESQAEYEEAKKDYERRKNLLIGDKKNPGKYYGHTALVNDIQITSETVHRKGYDVKETDYNVTTIERIGAD